jgi:tetraacyldisaccharide 4'-kinase
LNQEFYRKLISGQSRGLSAIFLRFCLGFAAAGYSLIVRLRNFLYSKSWLKIHHVNAVVFSVGNITTGGTGKTPLVIWLCNYLTQNLNLKTKNYGCAILTRGYKTRCASSVMRRAKNARNTQYAIRNTDIDEPAIIAESCPQAKVIINPDRIAGAVEAIDKSGAKILIMDDGFQHRRLARDLDIVTVDATLPFGYGRLLPAGMLREPLSALKRANAVVITRGDQVTEAKLAELEQKLQHINPKMIIARSIHAPVCAKSAEDKEIDVEKLKNKRIFAFCGIGNPDAFFETIKGLGCELIGLKTYNDHYYYKEGDIADIHRQAERLEADLVLTTQKDWSSTQYAIHDTQYEISFAYLKIELKFLTGVDKLKALIEKTLSGKITAK